MNVITYPWLNWSLSMLEKWVTDLEYGKSDMIFHQQKYISHQIFVFLDNLLFVIHIWNHVWCYKSLSNWLERHAICHNIIAKFVVRWTLVSVSIHATCDKNNRIWISNPAGAFLSEGITSSLVLFETMNRLINLVTWQGVSQSVNRIYIRAWVVSYINCLVWDAIIHPCPHADGGLPKLPLKSGYGWIITSYHFA